MNGTVLKNENGYFKVQNSEGKQFTCKVRGRLKQSRYRLLVGDTVTFVDTGDGEGAIEQILPRKNSLHRPYVANIDQVIVTVAAHDPDINLLLLDKLLVMIENEEIPICLCINKWDIHDDASKHIARLYESIGYDVICTSTYTGDGIDVLRQRLMHKTTAFAGPSGAGKSSLLNAVEPAFSFQTGAVSHKIKRGRHTTRHASLFPIDEDTFIMDTPGFSAITFDQIAKIRLPSLFPEFQNYIEHCKFNTCLHTHEPICGIKAAAEVGKISNTRYDNYVTILNEINTKR